MISGIGGGMVRDLLTAQVPTVLRADIYAVAARAGALVVVAGSEVGFFRPPPLPWPGSRSACSCA
jgi:uncharacterized membrane protein YeiH